MGTLFVFVVEQNSNGSEDWYSVPHTAGHSRHEAWHRLADKIAELEPTALQEKMELRRSTFRVRRYSRVQGDAE